LYASDPTTFTLFLPQRHEQDSSSGYSLEHLKVMYPSLNVSALADCIAEVQRKSESDGGRLRNIKADAAQSPVIEDDELRDNALKLLQVVAHRVDQRTAESFVEAPNSVASASGLTASEIFDLGRQFGWHDAQISTLFDILIDDANLVTRVERIQDDGGCWRWVRTFKPDGEVVSELVRRYTVQWGLPRGF
jgi:hypothetical protein